MANRRDKITSTFTIPAQRESNVRSTHSESRSPSVIEDQVRQRAFELFRARQERALHGDPLSDWIAAEREVKEKQVHRSR